MAIGAGEVAATLTRGSHPEVAEEVVLTGTVKRARRSLAAAADAVVVGESPASDAR